MSRPGFSEFRKSMCKSVPNFIRRCVRDDPYLCWQNIGAGKYRTIQRLRPFSAHFHGMAPQGIIYMSNTQEIKYV